MKVFLDLVPQRIAARAVPHRGDHVQQHGIARGLCDAQVKLPVCGVVGLLVVHVLAHRGEREKDTIEIAVFALHGRERRYFGFDQGTRSQRFDRPRAAWQLEAHRRAPRSAAT